MPMANPPPHHILLGLDRSTGVKALIFCIGCLFLMECKIIFKRYYGKFFLVSTLPEGLCAILVERKIRLGSYLLPGKLWTIGFAQNQILWNLNSSKCGF